MGKRKASSVWARPVWVLPAALLAGCDGGSGYDDGVSVVPEPPPGQFSPNFSEIQSNVFTPTCATTGCHSGAGAPQGLRLDAANSFGLLVNVASSQIPSILRVAPGDPDNSYLIQKLEGTAGAGERMPLGRPQLSQASIDVIRQWIIDGAIDDRAQSDSAIRVTSLSPLPDSKLAASPSEIIVMFDREPDASSVNRNTFIVEGSGGDGTFDDGNEVPVEPAAISMPARANKVSIDLDGITLADDTYRVRLQGSGPSLLLDRAGNALDGEFAGTFPSGDGTTGADFKAEFTLAASPAGTPTLDRIQAEIFTPGCSACHAGPMGGPLPAGLDLSNAEASYRSLVGVPSTQEPVLSRVAPGNPEDSYLIRKLEGTTGTGDRMPNDGSPLDRRVIDDIRQWIVDGAQR